MKRLVQCYQDIGVVLQGLEGFFLSYLQNHINELDVKVWFGGITGGEG